MRNIKLLVTDLDGTAIPVDRHGKPSPKTITAIKQAQQRVRVVVATGRSYTTGHELIAQLQISDPCIVSGGTQIIRPQNWEILWSKQLSSQSLSKIFSLCTNANFEVWVDQGKGGDKLPNNQTLVNQAYIVYFIGVTKQDTEKMVKQLVLIEDITVHFMESWKKGYMDIHITHVEATKKHALEELISLLGISSHEVMVVGDNSNDMPLFEAAGVKIAMGNATPELKAKADFVTKSVDEDGLAYAIEKFILNPS